MIHRCRWPGCRREITPDRWGCLAHWLALPSALRTAFSHARANGYRAGDHPNAEYRSATARAKAWALEHTTTISADAPSPAPSHPPPLVAQFPCCFGEGGEHRPGCPKGGASIGGSTKSQPGV